jgi:hypothetical protein
MHLRSAVIFVTISAFLPTLRAGVDSNDKSEAPELVAANVAANMVAPAATIAIPRPKIDMPVKVRSRWITAWEASVAFHGAGSAFDAFTSYHRGPYESNVLLSDPNGQFGNKAVMIKMGAFGAITAAQWVVVRKWPHTAKFFVPFNAGMGGMYFLIGRHNQQIVQGH